VDAILRIVMRTPEPAMLRVLNLCGDEEVSLRDVCAKVGQMLGREAKLLANDRTPLHLSGTSERAKVLLQWQPQVSMHDGLTALVAAS
jgi:nucleoside-diphosphate-sugar epimerase